MVRSKRGVFFMRYIIMLVIVSMLSIGCTMLYTDQSRRLEKIESRIESIQCRIDILETCYIDGEFDEDMGNDTLDCQNVD